MVLRDGGGATRVQRCGGVPAAAGGRSRSCAGRAGAGTTGSDRALHVNSLILMVVMVMRTAVMMLW